MHRAQEDENDTGKRSAVGLFELMHERTSHLGDAHIRFFLDWDTTLQFELVGGNGNGSKDRLFWLQSSMESEERGTCLGAMRLSSQSTRQSYSHGASTDAHKTDANILQQHGQRAGVATTILARVGEREVVHIFVRDSKACSGERFRSALSSSSLSEGDQVLLSIEGSIHVAIARGSIREVTTDSVSVSMKRALRRPDGDAFQCTWRIDRDVRTSLVGKMRGNFVDMCRDSTHAARLRALIIDLEAPVDTNDDADGENGCSGVDSGRACSSNGISESMLSTFLNDGQQRALSRLLSLRRDYMLVYGMPGTGKTALLAAAVRELARRRRRVLISSFTNSALDTLLLRIVDGGTTVLRLGGMDSIDTRMRPYSLNATTDGGDHDCGGGGTGALRARLRAAHVVGCTCYGAVSPLMKRLVAEEGLFDVVIVDESTQISLPAVLGPLLCGASFCLVGDPNQLPPLVVDAEAARRGMAESLFARLHRAHPDATVELGCQYRMAEDIMALSNALVYDGRLSCATAEVAQQALAYTKPIPPSLPRWVSEAMQASRRTVFVDTSSSGEDALECRDGGGHSTVTNRFEAELAVALVRALTAAGIGRRDILLMSPLRAQVAALARATASDGVDALTIDKAQGSDRPCVIMSMVRANASGESGMLLADWRRLNVSVTRAQKKLVIIGHGETLRRRGHNAFLAKMLDMIEAQGGLVHVSG